jgi:transcriptional regulator with XRE-family HTH domain
LSAWETYWKTFTKWKKTLRECARSLRLGFGRAVLKFKMKDSKMGTAVAKILGRLKDEGGLQGRDIANIVSASPPTVSRWLKGTSSPDIKTQTRIAQLGYLVDRLSEYYTAEETRLWLHTPHPMLEGRRAIDLLNEGKMEDVLAVIESIDAGAYT